MDSNNQPVDERPLYGLYFIIAIQALALILVLYDEIFVAEEPQIWLIAIGGGGTIAVSVGLFLFINAARIIQLAFAGFSAFVTMFGLAYVLFMTWSSISTKELFFLLVENGIPLAFTIWLMLYLTREDVRIRFVGAGITKEHPLSQGQSTDR
jgi:hypothetical protein